MLRISVSEWVKTWIQQIDSSKYLPFIVCHDCHLIILGHSMPKERFIGCYNVPQWRMPSMSTLVRVAKQTMSQLIIHVPIVHTPTFRLNEVAPAVAFSLCMVGSPWHSPIAGDHLSKSLNKHSYPYVKMLDQQDWLKGMGVIAPGATTCTIEEIEDTPMEERDFEDRKKVSLPTGSTMRISVLICFIATTADRDGEKCDDA